MSSENALLLLRPLIYEMSYKKRQELYVKYGSVIVINNNRSVAVLILGVSYDYCGRRVPRFWPAHEEALNKTQRRMQSVRCVRKRVQSSAF